MNRAETVNLLSFCAANDQRTVGEFDVAVWFDMLGPIPFEAAIDAARMHYRRVPDVRLKPGHLWRMCSVMTDAEAAEHELSRPCDHGVLCKTCSAVHHQDEPCSVLISKPLMRALVGAFRTVDPLETTP